MNKWVWSLWFGAVAAGVACPAVAQDLETPACRRIEQSLVGLSTHLESMCVVSGMKAGASATLLLIAKGKPSTSPKAWRAYMMFGCLAVGERLNAVRALKLNQVWLTDAAMVTAGRAYSLQAGSCKKWQAEVHAGRVDAQSVASTIESAATPVSVAR